MRVRCARGLEERGRRRLHDTRPDEDQGREEARAKGPEERAESVPAWRDDGREGQAGQHLREGAAAQEAERDGVGVRRGSSFPLVLRTPTPPRSVPRSRGSAGGRGRPRAPALGRIKQWRNERLEPAGRDPEVRRHDLRGGARLPAGLQPRCVARRRHELPVRPRCPAPREPGPGTRGPQLGRPNHGHLVGPGGQMVSPVHRVYARDGVLGVAAG